MCTGTMSKQFGEERGAQWAVGSSGQPAYLAEGAPAEAVALRLVPLEAQVGLAPGAYTRSLLSST